MFRLVKTMSNINYFTKVQNNVERWISDLGFKVLSEVGVEQYVADLVVNELDLIVEVDGPSHRKLPPEGRLITKESIWKEKRDVVLLNYFKNGIFHIPVSITEERFKQEFMKLIRGLEC